MSALYIMRYLGQSGVGFGTLYIGKGVILGVDVSNARYQGTYTEANGRIRATANLTAPIGGAALVTGQRIPAGQSIPLSADWPSDFANGQPQSLSVMGHTVNVTFEKIGDLP